MDYIDYLKTLKQVRLRFLISLRKHVLSQKGVLISFNEDQINLTIINHEFIIEFEYYTTMYSATGKVYKVLKNNITNNDRELIRLENINIKLEMNGHIGFIPDQNEPYSPEVLVFLLLQEIKKAEKQLSLQPPKSE